MSSLEILVLSAQFGILVTQIAVLIAAIIQIRALRRSFLADHERRRKQATIEYLDSFRSEVRPMVDQLKIIFPRTIAIDPNDLNEEHADSIKKYMNILEALSSGVNTNVYDIDIVDRRYRRWFIEDGYIFKKYIESRRKETQNERLYLEFEELVDKLKSRESKIPPRLGHTEYS